MFNGGIARFTPNTIRDVRTLLAELRRTRRRGYAIDNEETALGLRCVAVACDLPGIGLTGMSVSGPAADYDEATIPSFVEAIRKTAAALNAALESNSGFREVPTSAPVAGVNMERSRLDVKRSAL
jgi:IclR family acetate operon transcriptional repressor